MDALYQPILFGSVLVLLSILAGMLSSRLGAPLLLIFLGLGMLAGQDGPGGIEFNDFRLTYLVGSMALAIILFDGGLRTPRATVRLALWPALSLATIGVVATAGFVGVIAAFALGLSPLQAFLLGATIASTDAAAVFILLHARGTEINKRVSATLELESGMNDPMAVFLTIICVELLMIPDLSFSWHLAGSFLWEMAGGAILGAAGGYAILFLINRIEIASGLYPIFAAAGALAVFGATQLAHASGFLAVYLAGLVLGNHRHRAQLVISRFHDGLAWLAQIGMFLVLGLLATPTQMFHDVMGEFAVAAGLILIARPLAVWLSLLPFRFTWEDKLFISWVGLRGAVPIFLASIPVLAGVPQAMTYFNVAFVVVLTSLVIQGWTVSRAARVLGLEMPPAPETERREIDMPATADRDAAGWSVEEGSPALSMPFRSLPLPRRTRVIAVVREGALMNRETLERLAVDDYVIALAPPEHQLALDKLFSKPPPARRGLLQTTGLGEFVFDADITLGRLCGQYGIPFDPLDKDRSLADFMVMRLGETIVPGDRVRIGEVELVVREMEGDRPSKVGLELEGEAERLPIVRLWQRLVGGLRRRR